MKKFCYRTLLFLIVLTQFTSIYAQKKDSVSNNTKAIDTMNRPFAYVIELRNDFIGKIKKMGYTPGLKPPEIVMDNPRSFGNYDKEKNILHTGDWKTLPPEAKAKFEAAAQKIGKGMTGQQYFEVGVQRWIIIHELGHWWRACQNQTALPYASEMAANRIDIAYWREQNPEYLKFKLERFEDHLIKIQSPVPQGQSKETYFNDNYNNLPGGDSYTWYQSTMIIDGSQEKPTLTFKQAIDGAGNASPANNPGVQ